MKSQTIGTDIRAIDIKCHAGSTAIIGIQGVIRSCNVYGTATCCHKGIGRTRRIYIKSAVFEINGMTGVVCQGDCLIIAGVENLTRVGESGAASRVVVD